MAYDEKLADRVRGALEKPGAREMDFTGRAMKGMVYVRARGLQPAPRLKAWVEQGLSDARSLPPKNYPRTHDS